MSVATTPAIESCSADSAASARATAPATTRATISRSPPTSRCHSHNTTIEASHQNAANRKPPIHVAATATLPIATAAATRGQRSGPNRCGADPVAGPSSLAVMPIPSRRRLDGGRLDESAEPTLARRILIERGDESRVVEIRPQDRQEDEFGIGRLPEQEIRQPHLAGGADYEIGIGKSGRVEPVGQIVLPDRLGVEAPVTNVDRKAPRRLDDLLPGAIIESHRQRKPPID